MMGQALGRRVAEKLRVAAGEVCPCGEGQQQRARRGRIELQGHAHLTIYLSLSRPSLRPKIRSSISSKLLTPVDTV